MKRIRMTLAFAVIGLLAFSCGQPTPPADIPAPPVEEMAVTPDDAEAAVVEDAADLDDAGEQEEEAATPAAPEPEEPAEVTAAVEGGTPKMVVPEPVWDFGTRRDSETVTHGFVVRNEGTGILEIRNVRAACGCTAMELEKDRLAPGEEVEVVAQTNLRGRQGDNSFAVTVTTNDPEEPMKRLMMRGNVQAAITIEPSNINFGEVYDDTPLEETVNISATVDDLTFEITSVTLPGMDFMEHEIEEVEPGRSYNVTLRTSGPLEQGDYRNRMIFRTDYRERPVIWLPVNLQVVGAIQVTPATINVMAREDEEPLPLMQVRISPGRVKEFTIEEVVVPLARIEADLLSSGDNIYLLRLSNIPQSTALKDTAIILRTDAEGHEEIKIPFNVVEPRIQPQTRPTRHLSPEQIEEMRQRARAGMDPQPE